MTVSNRTARFARCPATGRNRRSLAVGARSSEGLLSLRVFGCLPGAGVRGCSEAGVRKAWKEETAGGFAPAVVSVYGDLTRVFGLISRCRIGTTAEQVP